MSQNIKIAVEWLRYLNFNKDEICKKNMIFDTESFMLGDLCLIRNLIRCFQPQWYQRNQICKFKINAKNVKITKIHQIYTIKLFLEIVTFVQVKINWHDNYLLSCWREDKLSKIDVAILIPLIHHKCLFKFHLIFHSRFIELITLIK